VIGVEYFYDEKGKPKAVLIDLRKNRQLWEDFQDIMFARQRRDEPRVAKEKVEERLRELGKTK
jgi:hypothetical protein